MVERASDPFFDGLVYDDLVPVVWAYLDSQPRDEQLVSANDANTQLLRLITSLSDRLPEQGDENFECNAELERLDLKLNVLLDIAGQLIRDQLKLPNGDPISLGHNGLEWWVEQAPDTGRLISLKLYIDGVVPRPLQLFGVVRINDKRATVDGRTPVRIKYMGLGQALEDELEKFIFRHHRKRIALERQPDKTRL